MRSHYGPPIFPLPLAPILPSSPEHVCEAYEEAQHEDREEEQQQDRDRMDQARRMPRHRHGAEPKAREWGPWC